MVRGDRSGPSADTAPRGRRWVVLGAAWPARLFVVIAVLAAVTAVPSTAWAADAVVATNPADRAALAGAPTEVDLRLSGKPDPNASHVTVFDAASADLDAGTAARVGDDVLRQTVAIRATGNFTIAYHVVFTDGHDTVGVVRFSVGTGVAPPTPAPAQQRADEAVAEQHDHDIDPISGTFLVLDVVVVAGVVLLLFSNPRRRRSAAARKIRRDIID